MIHPKTISLFSGCGGSDLGLSQAGYDIRLAIDIDKNSCETYVNNFKNTMWNADLSNTPSLEILRKANLKKDEVDLIVGGPPCQGFSSAGSKDWNDPRNNQLKNFVKFVVEIKPKWFIMENVEGLLTSGDGFFISKSIERFLEAGYWVKCKKIYMESYGIPQKRKRVFLVGNLEKCQFDFPTPQIKDNPVSETSLHLFQIIKDYSKKQIIPNNECKNARDIVLRRIKLLKQGETMKHLPEHLQHDSFKRRAFRRVMDGTPTEKRGGAPSGLRRLKETTISPTITSASPTEFVHPTENRFLTLRECARLQTFPDDFKFFGPPTSIALQIGNAIPPMFMTILGKHVLKLATWKKASSKKGKWLGIDATKSSGMSPSLENTLKTLEAMTIEYV